MKRRREVAVDPDQVAASGQQPCRQLPLAPFGDLRPASQLSTLAPLIWRHKHLYAPAVPVRAERHQPGALQAVRAVIGQELLGVPQDRRANP
jgi:hypothetical protein